MYALACLDPAQFWLRTLTDGNLASDIFCHILWQQAASLSLRNNFKSALLSDLYVGDWAYMHLALGSGGRAWENSEVKQQVLRILCKQ